MIRIEGNTIYAGAEPVAVIFDAAGAAAKKEFVDQINRLGVLDQLDQAKLTVLSIAGNVATLAAQMQVENGADIEELLG